MTNNNQEVINNAQVEGMETIPVINEEEIVNAGGKKMKVRVKKDMKKYVKPAIIFGAGAATCYVGMKVIPMMVAKKAADKAVDVVVDTAVDAAVTTAVDAAVATAATVMTAALL